MENTKTCPIAVITDPEYQHAMLAIQDNTAFVMPSSMADKLQDHEGAPIAGGFQFRVEDCSTEDVGAMDTLMLSTVYSIVLARLSDELGNASDPDEFMRIIDDLEAPRPIRLPVREFMEKTGHSRKTKPDAMKRKLKALGRLSGLHSVGDRPGELYERLDVLTDFSEDAGVISFSSPYCERIARTLAKKHLVWKR